MAKTITPAFKKAIQEGGPFYAYANVALKRTQEQINQDEPATVLHLSSDKDFMITNNSYTHNAGSGFPVGQALCKTISLAIDNADGRYDDYDFNGSTINLFTEVETDNYILVTQEPNPFDPTDYYKIEDGEYVQGEYDDEWAADTWYIREVSRVQEGYFTVVAKVSPGYIIKLTAYDKMYKTDRPYKHTKKTFTQTWQYLGTLCGITVDTSWISETPFGSTYLKELENEITARQMISYMATMVCGNAYIKPTGELSVKFWNLNRINNLGVISGGKFTDSTEDVISGGSFTDNTEDVIIGIDNNHPDIKNVKVLNTYSQSPTVAVDDVMFTGAKVTYKDPADSEDKNVIYPTPANEDYLFEVKNEFGNNDAIAHIIADRIVGHPFRPFSGTFAPDPSIEFMDFIYLIDNRDNVHISMITGLTFNYVGAMTLENTTQTSEKYSQSFSNATATSISEDAATRNSPYEVALEALIQAVTLSGGFYTTSVQQDDGSFIYYFHDQPLLANSQNIVKVTGAAIAVSNDGGQTWTAGVTINGDAVLNSLATKFLSADRIQGGTLSLGGYNDELGTMAVKDSSGDDFINIDNNGISIADPLTSWNNILNLSINGLKFGMVEPDPNSPTLSSVFEKASITFIPTAGTGGGAGTATITLSGNEIIIQGDVDVTLHHTSLGSLSFTGVGTDNKTPTDLSSTQVLIPTAISSDGKITNYQPCYLRNGILCTN